MKMIAASIVAVVITTALAIGSGWLEQRRSARRRAAAGRPRMQAQAAKVSLRAR